MLSKYQPLMNDIYEYVANRIRVEITPEAITNEVMSKYKIEIHFPVDKIILRDLVYRICESMYFAINNRFYKE